MAMTRQMFPQRPAPAGRVASQAPPTWCRTCGSTRYVVVLHGSRTPTYACPRGCDDYDPRRGKIDAWWCTRCGRTRQPRRVDASITRVYVCLIKCDRPPGFSPAQARARARSREARRVDVHDDVEPDDLTPIPIALEELLALEDEDTPADDASLRAAGFPDEAGESDDAECIVDSYATGAGTTDGGPVMTT